MSEHDDLNNVEFIARYLGGELSAAENEAAEQRLRIDAAFAAEVAELRKIWDFASDAALEVDLDAAWKKVESQTAQPVVVSINRPTSQWLKMAAGLALLLALPLVYWLYRPTPWAEVNSGALTSTLTLADGTTVWLNHSSTLRYPEQFDDSARQVWVDGVAYFEVKPDADRPFTVQTEHGSVRVVGTAFEVNTRPEAPGFSVEVSEGLVEVNASKSSQIERVMAGEMATVLAAEGVISVHHELPPDAFFWQSHTIKFKRTELDRVVKTLADAYGVRIDLSNANISGCELTATFENEPIETILDIISATLRLQWKKEGEAYTISGEGC